jgi:hypothetical protein
MTLLRNLLGAPQHGICADDENTPQYWSPCFEIGPKDGKFRCPNVQDDVIRLSAAQLSALLEGLDCPRVHAVRETPATMQPG